MFPLWKTHRTLLCTETCNNSHHSEDTKIHNCCVGSCTVSQNATCFIHGLVWNSRPSLIAVLVFQSRMAGNVSPLIRMHTHWPPLVPHYFADECLLLAFWPHSFDPLHEQCYAIADTLQREKTLLFIFLPMNFFVFLFLLSFAKAALDFMASSHRRN